MGAFVLGVLVGWLAEWLFYTFWVKAGKDNSDCSAIKAELELKNKQISSLQSQLASSSQEITTKASSGTQALDNSSTKTKTSSTSSKSAATKKVATAKKTTSNAKSTASGAKSSSTKATKKAATNKTVAASKSKKSSKGDDFTKLSGIGPSMSATLKSLGIDTFEKLAATEDDKLREMLEQSGARMNNNKEAMDSWNEQATVAAKGDFKKLKEMQAALKK